MATGMSTDNHRPLPKLLGYAELAAYFGWKKRTLQDWVRKGKLKPPGRYPGGRSAWLLEDIEAFIESQRAGLTAVAVSRSEDLTPDAMVDKARVYASKAYNDLTGIAIAPDDIAFVSMKPATAEGIEALERKQFAILSDYLAGLTDGEALSVAAAAFPQLGELLVSMSSDLNGFEPRHLATGADKTLAAYAWFELATRLLSDQYRSCDLRHPVESLAALDLSRSFVVAAWLFPALREPLQKRFSGILEEAVMEGDALQNAALAALDDTSWTQSAKSLIGTSDQVRNSPGRSRKTS